MSPWSVNPARGLNGETMTNTTDTTGQGFVGFFKDNCFFNRFSYARSRDLYKRYELWCKKNNQPCVLSKRALDRKFSEQNLHSIKIDKIRAWQGVALKDIRECNNQ